MIKNTQNKSEYAEQTSTQETRTESETNIESESVYKIDRNDLGIQIKPIDGKDYEIEYGGFKFKGSAEINLGDKKEKQDKTEKIRIQNKYQHWNVYKHWNVFHNTYKSSYKNIDARRDSFWLYVLTGVLSITIYKIIEKWIKSRGTGLQLFTRLLGRK